MPEGTITALQVQQRNRERVNLFLDDTFALGVSLTVVAHESLFVGKYIDAALWARLEAAEQADSALQAALRFVQTRPRSIAEVQARLARAALSPLAIDHAISRLQELNLLDDAAFARWWVEQRNTLRPRGPQALRAELLQKGVPRAIIDTTLADDALMADADAQALALARGVLTRYADAPDRATFQRRLGGYLQRRGFAYALVAQIVDQLWHELHKESE